MSVSAIGSGGNGTFGGVNDVQIYGKFTLISEEGFSVNGGGLDADDNEIGPFPNGKDSSPNLKLSDASLLTVASSTKALVIYDSAIRQVSRARADVGAMQSRFESVIANLDIATENTAAARARIVDADYAMETAQLAQQQILQNAGTAMLAQANSILANSVMALLKNV